ncbi:acyltransferase family protein [Muricoccus radiodurans]|uniref:acyltransferase family protein n=1 Tax=Muricoccus radiodurans TaxID=2231721 RepID=UPI003CF5D5F6
MERLAGIQYLRALAALGVVVFHVAEPLGANLEIGGAGVDIFFVISGFVIWHVQAASPRPPGLFLLNRAVRIIPTYWVATLCLLLLAALGLVPRMVLNPEHILASFLFLPAPSPSVPGLTLPFLGQGWTLNYEMAFYLLFALTIPLAAPRRLALLSAVLVGLVLAGWLVRPDSVAAVFYTRPIILEFVAGMIIARLHQARLLGNPLLGVTLTLAGILGLGLLMPLGGQPGTIAAGLAAAALVAGVVALEVAGRLPNLPGLGLLGDASYPIYIWHSFVLSVAFRIGDVLTLPRGLTAVIAVVGSAAAGVVLYCAMERPIGRLYRRVLNSAHPPKAQTSPAT